MAQLVAESTTGHRIGLVRRAWVVWAGISVLFVLVGVTATAEGP